MTTEESFDVLLQNIMDCIIARDISVFGINMETITLLNETQWTIRWVCDFSRYYNGAEKITNGMIHEAFMTDLNSFRVALNYYAGVIFPPLRGMQALVNYKNFYKNGGYWSMVNIMFDEANARESVEIDYSSIQKYDTAYVKSRITAPRNTPLEPGKTAQEAANLGSGNNNSELVKPHLPLVFTTKGEYNASVEAPRLAKTMFQLGQSFETEGNPGLVDSVVTFNIPVMGRIKKSPFSEEALQASLVGGEAFTPFAWSNVEIEPESQKVQYTTISKEGVYDLVVAFYADYANSVTGDKLFDCLTHRPMKTHAKMLARHNADVDKMLYFGSVDGISYRWQQAKAVLSGASIRVNLDFTVFNNAGQEWVGVEGTPSDLTRAGLLAVAVHALFCETCLRGTQQIRTGFFVVDRGGDGQIKVAVVAWTEIAKVYPNLFAGKNSAYLIKSALKTAFFHLFFRN